MINKLLIRGEDITQNSIIGGNVDRTKYASDIKTAQNLKIRPLLGRELYNKILTDYLNDNLSGDYEILYNDYVKELVIHASVEIYLSHGAYTVSNAGISKLVAQQGATSVNKEEVDFLIQASRRLYESYKEDMLNWLKDDPIPEFKIPCNTGRKSNRIGGWIL